MINATEVVAPEKKLTGVEITKISWACWREKNVKACNYGLREIFPSGGSL